MANNITFRTHLVGAVSDFCDASNLMLVHPVIKLAELIVLLAHYKEEGVNLSPQVYLTNNIDRAILMLPASEKFEVGIAEANAIGIKQALKKCAPLAGENWLIYMSEVNPDKIEFGLFRGSTRSIAVPVDSVIMTDGNADLVIIKIFQVAEECIELKSNFNKSHFIFLNNREENSPPPLEHLGNLVTAICKKSPAGISESLNSYLTKLLTNALRESHGSLVAVSSANTVPKFLKSDGIILAKSIDFVELILKLKSEEVSEEYLNSKANLVKGMFNSDGIVLFNNRGSLLGYNCFTTISKQNAVLGGARKRAFATLSSKVGKGLSAAFMQSQDGWTDFKG